MQDILAESKPTSVPCDVVVACAISVAASDFEHLAAFAALKGYIKNHGFFKATTAEDDESPLIISLPVLVVVYDNDEFDEAGNDRVLNAQDTCRMAIVSATAFLRSLGIRDYPVFGLVVDKVGRGSLQFAWMERGSPVSIKPI